jgi:hypothetical protein
LIWRRLAMIPCANSERPMRTAILFKTKAHLYVKLFTSLIIK